MKDAAIPLDLLGPCSAPAPVATTPAETGGQAHTPMQPKREQASSPHRQSASPKASTRSSHSQASQFVPSSRVSTGAGAGGGAGGDTILTPTGLAGMTVGGGFTTVIMSPPPPSPPFPPEPPFPPFPPAPPEESLFFFFSLESPPFSKTLTIVLLAAESGELVKTALTAEAAAAAAAPVCLNSPPMSARVLATSLLDDFGSCWSNLPAASLTPETTSAVLTLFEQSLPMAPPTAA
mmetsp:Transcript_38427/g.59983  ORF Transcript_38427/g.59983 Transcript_38427/m.59983 type:complete len:235 (-) Transcript_38427:405-1109(-)